MGGLFQRLSLIRISHIGPEQYAQLAERNGFHVDHTNTALNSWDFGSRENFFAFGQVTFVEWTRRLPDSEKTAFISDVLDRYAVAAANIAAPASKRSSARTCSTSTKWTSHLARFNITFGLSLGFFSFVCFVAFLLL